MVCGLLLCSEMALTVAFDLIVKKRALDFSKHLGLRVRSKK